MSKSLIGIGVVLGFFLMLGGCGVMLTVGSYNGLVNSSQAVDAQWGQVENVYQRRYDLIPNLVGTVRGYAIQEQDTLVAVTEARASVGQVTVDPSNLTAANLAQFQQAQDMLSNTLSRLMVVVERYPDLKANQNFLALQDELAGTENRIANERRRFNELAQTYNTQRLRFPTNIIANYFGFGEKPYFESQEGANTAPSVDFTDLRREQ